MKKIISSLSFGVKGNEIEESLFINQSSSFCHSRESFCHSRAPGKKYSWGESGNPGSKIIKFHLNKNGFTKINILIIFLLSLLTIFLFLISPNLIKYLDIQKANSDYNAKNYENSLKKYKKIEGELKGNNEKKDVLNYNIGLIYFELFKKNKDLKYFSGSINSLNKIDEKNISNELNFLKNLTLGKIYLYVSSSEKLECNTKIALLKKVLGYFETAIKIDINADKKELINLINQIQKEINSEEKTCKKDEQKKESQNQEKNNSSSGSKSSSGSDQGQSSQKEREEKEQIDGKKWTNSGQFNNLGNNSGEKKDDKMTQDEKRQLEEYKNSLQEFQKQNQNLLEKGKQKSTTDMYNEMLKNFQNDPMFDNVLPQNNNKDW